MSSRDFRRRLCSLVDARNLTHRDCSIGPGRHEFPSGDSRPQPFEIPHFGRIEENQANPNKAEGIKRDKSKDFNKNSKPKAHRVSLRRRTALERPPDAASCQHEKGERREVR